MTYRTIVADPPWQLDRLGVLSWRSGRPSGEGMNLDYPTMTVDEIAALPVAGWADESAHLFLWTTQRHLPTSFQIVEAWGFRYVCDLIWCKAPHGWGPGGAFQSTVEHCLYATRGQVGRLEQIERQWWEWPRGEHSAKPDAFLDLVEAHFPGPHLEMFSRRARFGWDTWGNEALHGTEAP